MTPDGRITSEFDDTAIIEPEEDDELADLELVVLDLVGTTVVDDGLVERAFVRAVDTAGLAGSEGDRERSLAFVRRTMGQEKAAVFRALTGDDDQAQHATAVFESAYAELVAAEGVRAVPGAEELVRLLRDAGVAVALTTGLSRATLDVVLDALGWDDLADVTLTADEAGRGRPYPDLPLTALLRTGATSVDGMVVVGDTASDIASGIAAGAGLVVGVLSGSHDERDLLDAGADAVVHSVADLAELLGFDDEDDPADEGRFAGDAVLAPAEGPAGR
ncbi:phosphonatase-like hydrolase [Leifsonia sp. ZF2019]|uniref:phosphonatase-like hydrolase n=1 Tax=Leifsonia sp. ZF2019 TaxID=2781978 RepID=UPI001CC148C1|nr:phosphonatase-like hydrolase [Leifsonia sp. ZF2019]UAJ79106.1 phosphonatase-like hydrolase [Leifsonia sp. ZF2019]